MTSLRVRRQALRLESELNRLALRAEWKNLRAAIPWPGADGSARRKLPPWWLVVAPLAGLLAARGLRNPGALLRGAGVLLRWAQPLYSLWRMFASGQR